MEAETRAEEAEEKVSTYQRLLHTPGGKVFVFVYPFDTFSFPIPAEECLHFPFFPLTWFPLVYLVLLLVFLSRSCPSLCPVQRGLLMDDRHAQSSV